MDESDPSTTPRHSVSVAAAIFDDSGEHVLLIQRRDNGNWEPPGGVLELDENIEQGLRREVGEETGAEIVIGPLTGVYKNMTRGIVALVFRCRVSAPPSAESEEAAAVSWHSLHSIEHVLEPAYAIRIKDAMQGQESGAPVALRTHDGHRLLNVGSSTTQTN